MFYSIVFGMSLGDTLGTALLFHMME